MIEPMGVKRFCAQAVELNGKLFVVGGYDGQRYLKSGECYDPANKSWEAIPDMGRARSNFSLTVLNGQLFAAGGTSDGKLISSSEYLNKFTNTWVEVGQMSSAMSAMSSLPVSVKELGEEITGSLVKISSLKDPEETS